MRGHRHVWLRHEAHAAAPDALLLNLDTPLFKRLSKPTTFRCSPPSARATLKQPEWLADKHWNFLADVFEARDRRPLPALNGRSCAERAIVTSRESFERCQPSILRRHTPQQLCELRA
jgi:hypothetical protein